MCVQNHQEGAQWKILSCSEKSCTVLETKDVPLKEKNQCFLKSSDSIDHYLLFSPASSQVFLGCYQGKDQNNACFCFVFNLNHEWPTGRCRPSKKASLMLDFCKNVETCQCPRISSSFPREGPFCIWLSRATEDCLGTWLLWPHPGRISCRLLFIILQKSNKRKLSLSKTNPQTQTHTRDPQTHTEWPTTHTHTHRGTHNSAMVGAEEDVS